MFSFCLCYKVNFIKNDNHFITGDLTNDKALCCLRLYSFVDVHHQDHKINNLSSTLKVRRTVVIRDVGKDVGKFP